MTVKMQMIIGCSVKLQLFQSQALQSLMGIAIVPMKASGRLRDGSAFLASQLMNSSIEKELLTEQQAEAINESLALIHQAGILHNDSHTGNILLPRPQDMLQQPLCADFGCAQPCHSSDAFTRELQSCCHMLAKHLRL